MARVGQPVVPLCGSVWGRAQRGDSTAAWPLRLPGRKLSPSIRPVASHFTFSPFPYATCVRLKIFYKSVWLSSVSFGYKKKKKLCVCVCFSFSKCGELNGLPDYTVDDVMTRKKNMSY